MKPILKTQEHLNPKQDDKEIFPKKNTLDEYDPFARNTHSESELQQDEREKSENSKCFQPESPGNLTPKKDFDPIPERPEEHKPEIPERSIPEIERSREKEHLQQNIPEIQKEHDDDRSTINKDDSGMISRVYPSIANHDNLEGTVDDNDENWNSEDSDLDIDSDSNKQD